MEKNMANMAFSGIATFGKTPYVNRPTREQADIAVLGVPYDAAIGYRPGTRFGPRAIRNSSTRYAFGEAGSGVGGYWDVNLKKRMLEGWRVVDAGDVDVLYLDMDYTYRQITGRVEQLLGEGIFPVVLGGDHSVSFPVLRAFAGRGPLNIVHIDAHLDFKDEVMGVRFGNSSPIRRMSELEFVKEIFSFGVRGIRTSEKDYGEALERGNIVVTAREFKKLGPEEVLSMLPGQQQYYVTIDIDALDPALAPGTGSPEAGGLDYECLLDFLRGLVRKGRVLGFDLVEVNPYFDPAEVTSLVAARLVLEFLGAIFE